MKPSYAWRHATAWNRWARFAAPGVRPHHGAATPWVGPPGHRLRVLSLALGLDLSRGYNQAQFCVIRAFLYFLGLHIPEYAFVDGKVDLQTQRANTWFDIKACQRFDLTIDKGDNSNTLVPTTAMRPDATAKSYSCGTWELAETDSMNS